MNLKVDKEIFELIQYGFLALSYSESNRTAHLSFDNREPSFEDALSEWEDSEFQKKGMEFIRLSGHFENFLESEAKHKARKENSAEDEKS